MIGITLPFNEINDQYLSLPISYIQILFQNKNEWLNPPINDLKNLNKDLTTKNIRSIVHINVKICVINLTGNFLFISLCSFSIFDKFPLQAVSIFLLRPTQIHVPFIFILKAFTPVVLFRCLIYNYICSTNLRPRNFAVFW